MFPARAGGLLPNTQIVATMMVSKNVRIDLNLYSGFNGSPPEELSCVSNLEIKPKIFLKSSDGNKKAAVLRPAARYFAP